MNTPEQEPRPSFLESINEFLEGREDTPDDNQPIRIRLTRRVRRKLQKKRRPQQRMAARLRKQSAKRHKANKQARRNRVTNRRNQVPHTRTEGR